MRIAGPGNAAKCQNLLDIAGGNAAKFQQLLTWTERLALRGAKPAYAAPPEVAAHGFSGANMGHFLDHTWEYVDLASRMGKEANDDVLAARHVAEPDQPLPGRIA